MLVSEDDIILNYLTPKNKDFFGNAIFKFCKIKGFYTIENKKDFYKIIFSEKINKIDDNVFNLFKVSVNYIDTFDYGLPEKNEYDRKSKPFIKTQLDKMLDDIIDHYVEYQLKQTKRIIAKEKSVEEAFEKQAYFIKKINELFSNTDKKIDEKENRLGFLLGDGTKLTPYQLSSGEKQLLIILLTVLVQDEQPSILIMDEPEISLHTRWQKDLIHIIRKLNPNCQLILATHSPSIFIDGHKEKITWMDDIISPTKVEKS